jgi:hypothetical protein
VALIAVTSSTGSSRSSTGASPTVLGARVVLAALRASHDVDLMSYFVIL